METHFSGNSRAASQLLSSFSDPKYSINRREAATNSRVSAAHEATSAFNRLTDSAFTVSSPRLASSDVSYRVLGHVPPNAPPHYRPAPPRTAWRPGRQH